MDTRERWWIEEATSDEVKRTLSFWQKVKARLYIDFVKWKGELYAFYCSKHGYYVNLRSGYGGERLYCHKCSKERWS